VDPRYAFAFETRALGNDGDGHPRYLTILSSETPDSYGDIVRQNWDLDRFEKHSVLVAGHDYRDTNAQIGKWADVRVKGRGKNRTLEGEAIYFAGEGNPRADWAEYIASIGEAAYSVGFMPLEMQKLNEDASDWWGPFEFLKSQLLEASHVNVPANGDAVQQALTRTYAAGELPAIRGLLEAGARTRTMQPTLETSFVITSTTTNDDDHQVQPIDEDAVTEIVMRVLREQGIEPATDPEPEDLETLVYRSIQRTLEGKKTA